MHLAPVKPLESPGCPGPQLPLELEQQEPSETPPEPLEPLEPPAGPKRKLPAWPAVGPRHRRLRQKLPPEHLEMPPAPLPPAPPASEWLRAGWRMRSLRLQGWLDRLGVPLGADPPSPWRHQSLCSSPESEGSSSQLGPLSDGYGSLSSVWLSTIPDSPALEWPESPPAEASGQGCLVELSGQGFQPEVVAAQLGDQACPGSAAGPVGVLASGPASQGLNLKSWSLAVDPGLTAGGTASGQGVTAGVQPLRLQAQALSLAQPKSWQ